MSKDPTKKFISGKVWSRDISLQEIFIFHGILIWMVIRPMPGRQYSEFWQFEENTYFTKFMTLSRFLQIRAVLHLS